ncbi:MAG: flagellar basal body rod protein FlgB [Proteobacteria bacterium]|nr:flagellar basal body rod protein FlgB [Desulfobulbaceae bacterium]MBU4152929.1 flagellar basal body rod protein FlgB [Pseudomonadota bacterium]MDP2104561.1 flagellar basal body rod protein FlgB [Desulfobulbaceae bacterium]
MPFTNKLFGGVIHASHLALDARMERQGLIQSNIANLETPGYVGQDFSFASVMKSAMLQQGKLAQTNKQHIALDPVTLSESMEFSRDRRPVDLDEEMQKLSENQLMFQVTTKILGSKFEGLKMAIDEGGK